MSRISPAGRFGSLVIAFGIMSLVYVFPTSAGGRPTRPADIPIEDFFRPAAFGVPLLNPSGTHVALSFHERKNDAVGLMFYDVGTGRHRGMRGDKDYDISQFRWVSDERIVYSVSTEKRFAWGLFAITLKKPEQVTMLNRFDALALLGSPRARPNHVLVAYHDVADEGAVVGKVLEFDTRRSNYTKNGNYEDNAVKHIAPPTGKDGVLNWWTDQQGELRYIVMHTKATRELFRRDGDRWVACPAAELDRHALLGVDADPYHFLVARSLPAGGGEVVRMDTRTGEIRETIHREAKYALTDAEPHFSSDGTTLIGLTYEHQASLQVWFQPHDVALQQSLDAALPENHVNLIIGRSRDSRRILVDSYSDRHPTTYYIFDREAGELSPFARTKPWLPPELMAPMRAMQFKTRDGLTLDGYITLPLSYDSKTPLPLIALPHGGPWVRDSWGFDARAQFFASRGYAVFQPNYRGSTGYGRTISVEPQYDFRKMHDDVTDGVKALIASRIADPHRVAIVGASFGGYLALAGVAFEPDLYRCAVTVSGVFDIESLIEDDRRNANHYRRAGLQDAFGDPRVNREKFEAISPLRSVALIKSPVFVAHGEDDRNAATAQSRRLVRAFASVGVENESLFLKYEGHSIAALKNRVELYTRIEAFLKKHL